MFKKSTYYFYCILLLACYQLLIPTKSVAQVASNVGKAAVADTSHQTMLATGKLKSSSFWALPPGDGYALRFAAPATSQHQLTSLRLHFGYFGSRLAKGRVRLRLARVAANGHPAEDSLLAREVLISEQTLQYLDKPLVLTWPNERIVVPASGFFVILEGLGDTADEYVIQSPRVVLAGAGNSHIGRRSQPGVTTRLLSTWSIPELSGAKPTGNQVELWAHGGDTPEWKSFPLSKQLPMLEVGFK